MGRSVMTHPRAEVTAYADWQEGYTSICSWCDEEVKFDGSNWVLAYQNDLAEHCEVHYADLVAAGESPDDGMDGAPHSGWEYDSDNWKDDLESTTSYMKELWPSLWEADRWPHNEVHVFLENDLVEFSVSEYCGLTALCIAVKEGALYDGRGGLAQHWIKQISGKFERSFSTYYKIGTFSNGESVYEKREA